MNKRALGAGVLTAMMLFSPITGDYAEASTTKTTQQLTQKIMWGQSEVTATQIGKITFNTDVKIYKIVNGVEKFHQVAKKGSGWRVHGLIKDNKNSTYYDLGGGVRVLQSKLSIYEVVPITVVKKQVEKYGAKISWNEWSGFPQVSRLPSKAVEDKINKNISDNFYNQINLDTFASYRIVKNSNNILELLVKYRGQDQQVDVSWEFEEILTYSLITGEVKVTKK